MTSGVWSRVERSQTRSARWAQRDWMSDVQSQRQALPHAGGACKRVWLIQTASHLLVRRESPFRSKRHAFCLALASRTEERTDASYIGARRIASELGRRTLKCSGLCRHLYRKDKHSAGTYSYGACWQHNPQWDLARYQTARRVLPGNVSRLDTRMFPL